MPLTIESLANRFVTALNEIKNENLINGITEQQVIQVFATEFAKAVVQELQQNADVVGTCPPSGGPLTGGMIL